MALSGSDRGVTGFLRLGLRTQLLLAVLPAVALVCGGAWLVHLDLQQARERNTEVAHETELIGHHKTLLKAVVDAETGMRGYLLTGDPAFLEPYRNADAAFSQAFAALETGYAADDAHARQRLAQLGETFRYWRDEIARPLIEARRQLAVDLPRRADRVRDRFARHHDRLAGAVGGDGTLGLAAVGDLADAVARLELLAERMEATALADDWAAVAERARAYRSYLQERASRGSGVGRAGLEALSRSAAALVDAIDGLAEATAAAENRIGERVRSQAGKRIVDRIRMLNVDLVERQREARRLSVTEAEAATRHALWLATGAPLVAFALAIGALTLIGLDRVKRMRQLRASLDRLAHGDLSSRVPMTGRGDEVDELAHGFNRMADELQASHNEERLLSRISDLFSTAASLDEACHALERLGPRMFPGVQACLYIIAESRNAAIPRAAWPDPVEAQPLLRPGDCRALRAGRIHVTGNDDTDMVCSHHEHAAIEASVCVPLVAQDTVLGVFCLWRPSGRADEAEASINTQVASRLSEELGLFLANVRLRERLRDQSIRDPMTGLYNRRYLDETLERELSRVLRAERTLSVIAIDIDHFKRFNDDYGHDAGDAVLIAVAGELGNWLRAADMACRTGGEELLLVLPEAPLSVARERAEQVRAAIAGLAVSDQGRQLPAVTISLGIAVAPTHGDSPALLLRKADEALYVAKRNGRNRVEIASTGDTAGDASGAPEPD